VPTQLQELTQKRDTLVHQLATLQRECREMQAREKEA